MENFLLSFLLVFITHEDLSPGLVVTPGYYKGAVIKA